MVVVEQLENIHKKEGEEEISLNVISFARVPESGGGCFQATKANQMSLVEADAVGGWVCFASVHSAKWAASALTLGALSAVSAFLREGS